MSATEQFNATAKRLNLPPPGPPAPGSIVRYEGDPPQHIDGLLYGYAVTRPEWACVIKDGGPDSALEAAWWGLIGWWQDIIFPSLLLALSVTAFMWGFGAFG